MLRHASNLDGSVVSVFEGDEQSAQKLLKHLEAGSNAHSLRLEVILVSLGARPAVLASNVLQVRQIPLPLGCYRRLARRNAVPHASLTAAALNVGARRALSNCLLLASST